MSPITPFKGRPLDPEKPVKVYRNLHARTQGDRWSIVQGCHVVAHAAALMLRDARFTVSAAGLARSRRLGRKVVCAYAIGHVATTVTGAELSTRIAFDPKVAAFVDAEHQTPVTRAALVRLDERGCTATCEAPQ